MVYGRGMHLRAAVNHWLAGQGLEDEGRGMWMDLRGVSTECEDVCLTPLLMRKPPPQRKHWTARWAGCLLWWASADFCP